MLLFHFKICYVRVLWAHTLRSQRPFSASVQFCLYVRQSSLCIASFYFLKVSAYILFLSSLTFVLNSIHHVRRMNAILFVFFATVPKRKSLCYPLDIIIIVNNNKLMNAHLCFVHPVPSTVSLQGGDVLSVTAVHHHLCYRYIPL